MQVEYELFRSKKIIMNYFNTYPYKKGLAGYVYFNLSWFLISRTKLFSLSTRVADSSFRSLIQARTSCIISAGVRFLSNSFKMFM